MKDRLKPTNFVNYIWRDKNFVSNLLIPFAWVTKLVVNHKKNKFQKGGSWHPKIPVIVVGNIYVGGTGKTPVVIHLVKQLQLSGYKPAVISRGYGVKAKTEAIIGINPLDPDVFGDEPALIAKETGVTVAVHPQRVKAAKLVIQKHPQTDVIVMDDGLQHLKIARDIEIIVQDQRGIGNGRLLPAGPLRESKSRLQNVDIIINNAVTMQPQNLSNKSNDKPIQAYMQLKATSATSLDGKKTLAWDKWLEIYGNASISALAGIGNPKRFFDMLRLDLPEIRDFYALPDHTKINQKTFKDVSNDIVLITSKDAIKCSDIIDTRIWIVNATPKFNNELWVQFILDKLNKRKNYGKQLN